jgi:hypothetical protein
MVDLTMDIKDMSQIKDSTFDLVLDKACLDCLFVFFYYHLIFSAEIIPIKTLIKL